MQTARLGDEQRRHQWRDRDGNRWHWNSIEAQWRKTTNPNKLHTEPKDPDPLYFGPWVRFRPDVRRIIRHITALSETAWKQFLVPASVASVASVASL